MEKLEVVEGMQFDRGYLSPHFVTNAEKMKGRPIEPYIPHAREEDLEHASLIRPPREAALQQQVRC